MWTMNYELWTILFSQEHIVDGCDISGGDVAVTVDVASGDVAVVVIEQAVVDCRDIGTGDLPVDVHVTINEFQHIAKCQPWVGLVAILLKEVLVGSTFGT